MENQIVNKSELRVLSKFLSTTSINNLVRNEEYARYQRELKAFLFKRNITFERGSTLRDILQQCYSILLKTYRHELVYKNELITSFILQNYGFEDTVVFNEFRIKGSKADLVLINGVDKVFEIKTELDSPERLKTQIQDYKRAFRKVYIVTYHTLVEKYKRVISDEAIGLISFSDSKGISIVKDATLDTSQLCIDTMLRCLRKSEYSELIFNLSQSVPVVKDVHFFKECLKIAHSYDRETVHNGFLNIMKKRSIQNTTYFLSDKIPRCLKYICYSLDFSQKEYVSLTNYLSRKIY